MLVIGTSARVFPAAEYIHRAREMGAFIAHFNLERDDDHMQAGDWFVPDSVARSLPGIVLEAFPHENIPSIASGTGPGLPEEGNR